MSLDCTEMKHNGLEMNDQNGAEDSPLDFKKKDEVLVMGRLNVQESLGYVVAT